MAGSTYYLDQLLSGRSGSLLSGVSGVDSGKWIDVKGRRNLTIQFKGIGTATCRVHVSNDPTKPADNADEVIQVASVTANGMVSLTGPYRWIKVSVSAYTSGTISAFLEAV